MTQKKSQFKSIWNIPIEINNKEKNKISQNNIKEVQPNYPKNIPLISNKAQNFNQTYNQKIKNQSESNNKDQISLSEKVSNLNYNRVYINKSPYEIKVTQTNYLKNAPIINKSNTKDIMSSNNKTILNQFEKEPMKNYNKGENTYFSNCLKEVPKKHVKKENIINYIISHIFNSENLSKQNKPKKNYRKL